jgi:hypothetical protein
MSNPFATRFIRPGAIPFLFSDGQSAASLVEQLQRQHWWGQIIGPHGSGKSTLLATLVPVLEAAGRSVVQINLRQHQRRLPRLDRETLSPKTQFVVDGYEQLSWWSKLRLKWLCRRRGCGLLVTAHRDVGFSTIFQTRPSEQVAQRVVATLLNGSNAAITPEEMSAAFAASGYNVRETLFKLFDVYQLRAGEECNFSAADERG